MPTEQTIILAIVGMVGLFATATVYQRANRISSRYYGKKWHQHLSLISRTSSRTYNALSNSMVIERQRDSFKEFEVLLSSGERFFLLAADSMAAAYAALELSNDRNSKLINVALTNEW